jgi:hypothetical protein
MANAYPHILVTGAPRSGTTILGRLLSLPNQVIYIFEPFNQDIGLEGIDRSFAYLDDDPDLREEKYDAILRDLLNGRARFKINPWREKNPTPIKRIGRQFFRSGMQLRYQLDSASPFKRRYLIKDPMASYAAQYLHRTLGMQTVIIVRHPASTIASYKRLAWRFNLKHLTSQPKLMERYLEPVLGGLDVSALSAVEEWSYLWLANYTVLDVFLRQNPDMIMVRHEDLSLSPIPTMKRLYTELNLPFTWRVRTQIIRDTQKGNTVNPPAHVAHVLRRDSESTIDRWRTILTPPEIATIERITRPLAEKYYPSAHWW